MVPDGAFSSPPQTAEKDTFVFKLPFTVGVILLTLYKPLQWRDKSWTYILSKINLQKRSHFFWLRFHLATNATDLPWHRSQVPCLAEKGWKCSAHWSQQGSAHRHVYSWTWLLKEILDSLKQCCFNVIEQPEDLSVGALIWLKIFHWINSSLSEPWKQRWKPWLYLQHWLQMTD